MRLISFALTVAALEDGTKTVTRRLGWRSLCAGARLRAVDRLPRSGPGWRDLGVIEVVSVRREPLNAIEEPDCAREGFPGLDTVDFVEMFCEAMGCEPAAEVTRIEFRRAFEDA